MRQSFLSLGIATFLVLLGAQPAAEAQHKLRTSAVPSGTQVQVRLDTPLDTGEAKAGQTFTATVAEPVVAGGCTIFARGSKVNGRVVEAVSSGRLKRPASITLELTSVGTQPLRIDGKSHLVRNAEYIGGGAAAGAVIGAIAGGKKGAAIGAAAGAGAGTAGAYMTGKKEIVLPAETLLTFVVGGGGSTSAPAAKAATAGRGEETPESAQSNRGGERAEARGEHERSYESEDEDRDQERRGERGREALAMFTGRDQRLIRNYFADTSNLPPGLAKRGGNLPPGLERQLQRNGTLPPGLQKRVQPFPAELTRQLPPLPTGMSRVILAGRALILDRSNKILDVMALAR